MLKHISHSKKGLKRDKNQDRIFIFDEDSFYLFFVFDGVSSLPTSDLFIKHFIKNFKTKLNLLVPSGDNFAQLLYRSHTETLDENINGKSTISVLLYDKCLASFSYVSIGDSRIYIFNNQFIEKITVDHNLMHRPNILTKCLGNSDLSIHDFIPSKVENKVNFLICTDGFYSLMEEDLKEYFETYNFKHYKNIEKKLSYLQRRKNNDDSSYILIKNEVSIGDGSC